MLQFFTPFILALFGSSILWFLICSMCTLRDFASYCKYNNSWLLRLQFLVSYFMIGAIYANSIMATKSCENCKDQNVNDKNSLIYFVYTCLEIVCIFILIYTFGKFAIQPLN